jgi:hypothetical protein
MQENLNEQPPKWSDIGDGEKKYLSLETGKSYKISISKVVLVKRAFKAGDEPKLKAVCTLATIDGQPTNKIWETGSFSVMRELKKNIKEEIWMGAHILFLLKKKNEGDKISYVFEDLGTVESTV